MKLILTHILYTLSAISRNKNIDFVNEIKEKYILATNLSLEESEKSRKERFLENFYCSYLETELELFISELELFVAPMNKSRKPLNYYYKKIFRQSVQLQLFELLDIKKLDLKGNIIYLTKRYY
ncbi:hypothetical protein EDEG_03445 [Edhazardia aedis USNM 41457]|uniref:Uncharacterized protein n=1 Tax=Edhazardia aedis (strain USNM 41457) TaxID=1003232 RepID=J9D2T0_EDHAE|nr:hypothetical protein EDEG_03445 [Edhazardia aedis USNM 41457]|eukprot:EJW02106.1 hypothetical protein EDEG_03445 [Edhazardia aedis USNM 41457]